VGHGRGDTAAATGRSCKRRGSQAAGGHSNGGSSVAMLAFIGALASKDQLAAQQVNLLAKPLIWFASGVVAAVLCACLAYLTNLAIVRSANTYNKAWQHPYVSDGPNTRRWRISAEVLRWIAIASMTASVACFVTGVVTAKLAFERLPHYARAAP
jgi:hypothetical protein